MLARSQKEKLIRFAQALIDQENARVVFETQPLVMNFLSRPEVEAILA